MARRCVAVLLLSALAAAASTNHRDLYTEFLEASHLIGQQALHRKGNDPLMPIRAMAIDGPRDETDAIAHKYRREFDEGVRSIQWHLLSASPEQIHLSFATDPTSIHVLWVTGLQANASAYVELTSPGGQNTTVPASTWTYSPISVIPWYGYIHGTTLTNLAPGGKYTYRVGSAAGMSDPIAFTAPDRSKDTVRIAFGGDMGTVQLVGYTVAKAMASYHQANALDAFWHLGDIAYSTLDPPKWNFEFFWDTYLRQEQSLISQVPMPVTYGNHDFSGGDSGAFINRFRNPGTTAAGNFYWSYTHGPIKYVSMCTEVGLVPTICNYTKGSTQYQWLERELSSVNRTETPWLILAGHRPMYSSDKDTDSGALQVDIEPLLAKYKVDVELAGHMHETEVTAPVLFDQPNTTGVTVNSATSFTFTNPEAPVHITAGTLGAVINEKWANPAPAWSLYRQGTLFSGTYGFGVLTANHTTLRFEFILQSSQTVLWDLTVHRTQQ